MLPSRALTESAEANPSVTELSPQEALEQLLEGNARYRAARCLHPKQDASRRAAIAHDQHPFAAILGCSDSRVPPQLVFDQGLGELFTTRVAGNIADDAVIASLEYAVTVLGVPLLMVLGHKRCGAVATALEAVLEGRHVTKHVGYLVSAMAPAVEAAHCQAGDPLDNAVTANVHHVMGQLKAHPPFQEAVREGCLLVVGAIYDLDSGAVALTEALERIRGC